MPIGEFESDVRMEVIALVILLDWVVEVGIEFTTVLLLTVLASGALLSLVVTENVAVLVAVLVEFAPIGLDPVALSLPELMEGTVLVALFDVLTVELSSALRLELLDVEEMDLAVEAVMPATPGAPASIAFVLNVELDDNIGLDAETVL